MIKISLPILALILGVAHANIVVRPIVFVTTLTPSQEVGPIDPATPKAAHGNGIFIYDPATHILRFSLHYADLSGSPSMAHFHLGSPHNNGPAIQWICGMGGTVTCPAQNSGQIQGAWNVPINAIKPLLSGGVFVNFHTTLNASGEIRGQLLPQ